MMRGCVATPCCLCDGVDLTTVFSLGGAEIEQSYVRLRADGSLQTGKAVERDDLRQDLFKSSKHPKCLNKILVVIDDQETAPGLGC